MEDNSLIKSVSNVCSILNKHSVEYLIVGGTAVAFYGFSRMSLDSSGKAIDKHDLDFWYIPTYDNYYKLLNALYGLGLDVAEFRDEKTPDPRKSFFKLEEDEYKIDFLPELPGLPRFRPSFNNRQFAKIGEHEVPFIAYEDLIINKLKIGRKRISKMLFNLGAEETPKYSARPVSEC